MNFVVEEDCLITDCLDCSHCVSEIVGLFRIQSSKLCDCFGRVQVSET